MRAVNYLLIVVLLLIIYISSYFAIIFIYPKNISDESGWTDTWFGTIMWPLLMVDCRLTYTGPKSGDVTVVDFNDNPFWGGFNFIQNNIQYNYDASLLKGKLHMSGQLIKGKIVNITIERNFHLSENNRPYLSWRIKSVQ